MAERWGLAMPPDFKLIQRELRQLDDKTFLKELQADLKQVMDDQVVPDARRRAVAQNVPHEVPGTIQSGIDRRGPFVRAGGRRAPAAGVFEGTRAGGNRRHPVYARGGRPSWTWVTQQRRPFLLPAMQAHADDVREAAGQAVLDVLARAGLRS